MLVLTNAVSLFPWWGGVLLAVISYLGFHYSASQPSGSLEIGNAGTFVGKQMAITLAGFLQYLVPLGCLAGAAVSAYARHKRSRLFNQVADTPSRQSLEDMDWKEFELLVAEVFRRRGFVVDECGGGGADGGVDLMLTQHGERYLVQCKQWRKVKVGAPVVRELFGLMTASGAAGAFIVTSGGFTDEAMKFAEGKRIQLVGTKALLALLDKVPIQYAGTAPKAAVPPLCPQCGGAMVQRIAKRGQNAGTAFLGCVNYPKCRGVRPA